MRDDLAALLLKGLDRVIQKEIYEDGVDAGNLELVDAVLLGVFLRGELFLVDLLASIRLAARVTGRAPDALLCRNFRVALLDLTFDQLDAPDAGAPEFDLPAGAVRDGFQTADVAF